jgi:hypothetical protein
MGMGAGGNPIASVFGIRAQVLQAPQTVHPASPDPHPQKVPGILPGLLVLTQVDPKPFDLKNISALKYGNN